MKKFLMFIVIVITMVSCYCEPQVMFLSGEIQNVDNPNSISWHVGDTVVVRSTISLDSALGMYSSDVVWGKYLGTIPEEQLVNNSRRISRTWYRKAIIIK